MEDEDVKELHSMITNWAGKKGYQTSHLLAFLTSTFVGTMVMKNYSEDFMKRTCERMLNQFKEKIKTQLKP